MKKESICIVLLLCTGIGFFSCKESSDPIVGCTGTRIEPGEYFPAYPGSWWNYTTQDQTLARWEVQNEYQTIEGFCMPFFTNADGYISGASLAGYIYAGLGHGYFGNSAIYDLTTDTADYCPLSFVKFYNCWEAGYPKYRRKTAILDTIIALPNGKSSGEIIKVTETKTTDSTHRYIDYFARNIGLIKRDFVNPADTTEMITILALKEWFIGR